MTDTYKVKFVCGELQGEWLTGQKDRDVIRLYNALAKLTGQTVSELYKGAFLWDGIARRYSAFTYKGGNEKFTAVLYIVREY